MSKKKVVYLLGSGATHAVLKHAKPPKGVLTKDIQKAIEDSHPNSRMSGVIWNELITDGNDVEHLISVLESQHNYTASEKVRAYYRSALVSLAKAFSGNPPAMNLYNVLFDLHTGVSGLQEEVSCFMTLNYEDILEQCLRKHFGREIDYGLDTGETTGTTDKVPVLKLHGSFSWTNDRPIHIKPMTRVTDKTALWIPPGTEKKRENYPFNLLWGKAMECLMVCDVLRIIGCSLSRNDWGLIPMLYTVQTFSRRARRIDIEIIDYVKTGERIRDNYSYLKVKTITEIDDVIALYKGLFPHATSDELREEMEAQFKNTAINPFHSWLDAKIGSLVDVGIDIRTDRQFVYNFYHKVPT